MRPASPLLALSALLASLAPLPALAGELRGRLLFEDGKPASGLSVRAVPYESPEEAARREARRGADPAPLATVSSAADGRFALSVPRPDARFVVEVSGREAVGVLLDGVFEGSESEELPDATLARGEALAGRVVDGAGRPVAGAEVTLRPGGGGRFLGNEPERPPRRARTGEDGTFRFEGASREGNAVTAEKEGFAPARSGGLRSGALARPVVLTAGEPLAGALLLPDRKIPARGALVRLEGKATTRWVEAGEDGRFAIPNAPAGKGTLVADAGNAGYDESPLALPRKGAGAEKPLVVVLSRPAALEGRIVDAKSSRPVPRAKLVARVGAGSRVVRSGADGRYRLAPLPPGAASVRVDEPRYVVWEKRSIELRRGEARALDVALTPGATIAGRVVDENGAPVALAKGTLETAGKTAIEAMLRRVRGGGTPAFRSAPDGSFRATRLAPGNGQKLTVTHAEMEPATVAGLNLPPGGVKGDVRVVMRRGQAIRGLVHDRDGNPIAGAEVTLDREISLRTGRRGVVAGVNILGGAGDRTPVTTGPDGRFVLSGVAPGDWAVDVRKRGWGRERVEPVKVTEEGAAPVDVTLTPGAAIAGVVKSRKGEPVAGFSVNARSSGGGGAAAFGGSAAEPTGPDGAFLIEDLKAGQTYDLMVFGGSLMPQTKSGVTAPSERVEVTVTGTGRITGRAVDERTGRPLTDFTVSVEPDMTGGRVIRMAARAAGSRGRSFSPSQVVHDEEGAFALEDVAAGSWSLVVEAKGYQTARVGGIAVEEGATKENVEVRVSPGGSLKGRVLDARSGRGIPEAAVSHEPAAGAGPGGFGISFGMDDGGGLVTDADGRFEVEGLAPGRYKVSARHPDFAEESETVEVKESGGTLDLRLSAGGTLGGTVLSDGRQPVPGAEVSLGVEGDGGPGPRGMFGGVSTTTDAAGRFRFEHLGAGRYTVTAGLRSKSSAPESVVLAAGESKEDVLLTLSAGATIRGTVSGLSDAERANASVSASGLDGWFAGTRVGGDGRFELAGAPAGAIALVARAGDFLSSTRNASKQVVVREGETEVETEIVFEEGYSIGGRVTKGGRPLPDVNVNASKAGGGGGGGARSGEDGAYRLEGLTPGRYSVIAFGGMGEAPKSRSVEVDGDVTLDIEFTSARLTGTVVEAGSRRPLAEATVEAADPSASSGAPVIRRSYRTDSNGRFVIEGLEPKTYTLTVQKPDFLFEKRDATAAEQGSDDLVVELTRGEGIGIEVKDGLYGIPLRGVFARVTDASKKPVFGAPVSLDSQGRGEIPSLKPGVYQVWMDADGYAPVTAESVSVPSRPLSVVMTPGGTVEVHAGEKTLAAGSARLQFLTARGTPYQMGPWAEEGIVTVGLPVRRFENFAAGSYTLKTESETRTFQVQEGQTTIVTLP